MADLNTWYPANWNGRPPQMPPGDLFVWRMFLARRGTEWGAYAYDVELHGGPTPRASSDPGLARAWARCIAKRADVVARSDAGYTIIEVRRAAGWSTIGQLLTYRRMFPIDYPDRQTTGALIACETIDPDARETAEAEGLQVWTADQLH